VLVSLDPQKISCEKLTFYTDDLPKINQCVWFVRQKRRKNIPPLLLYNKLHLLHPFWPNDSCTRVHWKRIFELILFSCLMILLTRTKLCFWCCVHIYMIHSEKGACMLRKESNGNFKNAAFLLVNLFRRFPKCKLTLLTELTEYT
jgi:hypothetical protein